MSEPFFDRVSNKALGQLLVERGFITPDECAAGLDHARARGLRLGEALYEMGLATQNQISYAVGEQFGLRPLELTPDMVDPELVSRFPFDLLQRHLLLPLIVEGDTLVVVVSDPHNLDGLRALGTILPEYRVSAQIGDPNQIRRCLETPEVRRAAAESTQSRTPSATGPKATPRQNDMVAWLVSTALEEPASDLLVQTRGGDAVVVRVPADGSPIRVIHEFRAAFFPVVRSGLLHGSAPISPVRGEAAIWRLPFTAGGAGCLLQIVISADAGGDTLRIRPLAVDGAAREGGRQEPPPSPPFAALPEFGLLLYRDPDDLGCAVAALMRRELARGIPLVLHEVVRRVVPGVAYLPASLTDPVAATISRGASVVVTDHPISSRHALRIRGALANAPAVIAAAPLPAGPAAASPDAADFLRLPGVMAAEIGPGGRAEIRTPDLAATLLQGAPAAVMAPAAAKGKG